MRLKCKKAGQDIRDTGGMPLACKACEGTITIVGKRREVGPVGNMVSFPRTPMAPFNCPGLLKDPTEGGLVEEV